MSDAVLVLAKWRYTAVVSIGLRRSDGMKMGGFELEKDAIQKSVSEMAESLERLGNAVVARDGNPDACYANALAALGILVASHIRAYANGGNVHEVVDEFRQSVAMFLRENPLEIIRPQGSA